MIFNAFHVVFSIVVSLLNKEYGVLRDVFY